MSLAGKKDMGLPTVNELAILAASMAGEKPANEKADQALRVWFAAKFLIERMEATIRDCPEEDRETLRGAFGDETDRHVGKPPV